MPLRLTGRPGSTATLTVAGGGAVSPAQVRFDATGVADAAVTSPAAGTVTVLARADGGTLTRAARASAGATTPQETIFLTPAAYAASAAVAFDDCPVIPLDTTPALPLGGGAPGVADGPLSPLCKLLTPSGSTPGTASPRRPNQSSPTFTVTKTGPARAQAGTTVSYRIRVRNRGATALAGLAVADDLPAGMSLAASPPAPTCAADAWSGPSAARRRPHPHPHGERAHRRRRHGAPLQPRHRQPYRDATARASACTRITSTPRPLQPAVTA